MQSCPKIVEQRAQILCYNGFGFQAPSEIMKDKFALAVIPNEIDIEKIKEKSGSKTLEYAYYLDKIFLTIHWTEYNMKFIILNEILQYHGYTSFTINIINKIRVQKYGDNNIYNVNDSTLEHGIINEYNMMKKHGLDDTIIINTIFKTSIYKSYNWKTVEGKLFCRKLRTSLGKRADNTDSKNNYFNWEIFKNCDFNTLLTTDEKVEVEEEKEVKIEDEEKEVKVEEEKEVKVEEEKEVKVEEEKEVNDEKKGDIKGWDVEVGDDYSMDIDDDIIKEQIQILEDINKRNMIKEKEEDSMVIDDDEEGICLMCMDRKANTIVYPCKCNVICSECSVQLRNTNDSDICFQCRRSIDVKRIEIKND